MRQETEIQQCKPVQRLSALKTEVEATQSTITRQVFAWLFPFSSPGWNAGALPVSVRQSGEG